MARKASLWNFHRTDLLHTFLTGFLLFKQFTLTGNIATVALSQHILS